MNYYPEQLGYKGHYHVWKFRGSGGRNESRVLTRVEKPFSRRTAQAYIQTVAGKDYSGWV